MIRRIPWGNTGANRACATNPPGGFFEITLDASSAYGPIPIVCKWCAGKPQSHSKMPGSELLGRGYERLVIDEEDNLICNQGVAGSNPAAGTNDFNMLSTTNNLVGKARQHSSGIGLPHDRTRHTL